MKRSVAILGPTPSFLRWAIGHPCPLREPVDQGLAASTFRQLRGVRELSLAQIEDRIVEGVGLHPDASPTAPEQALGFSVAEIVAPFGGLDHVTHCCQGCPANAGSNIQPRLLAGCYGWLPADLETDFEEVVRGQSIHRGRFANPDHDHRIVEMLEKVVLECAPGPDLAEHFLPTSPVWYGLWSRAISGPALPILELLLRELLSLVEASAGLRTADLIRFVDAVSICGQRDLELQAELVPAGFSDGITWTLRPHCRICKFEGRAKMAGGVCPCCRQAGTWQNEVKSKVLGLRPYLQLAAVFGLEATKKMLAERDSQRHHDQGENE